MIADFGETYELNKEEVKLTAKSERRLPVNKRKEVLNRLEKLREEIFDMEACVKEDMDNRK